MTLCCWVFVAPHITPLCFKTSELFTQQYIITTQMICNFSNTDVETSSSTSFFAQYFKMEE